MVDYTIMELITCLLYCSSRAGYDTLLKLLAKLEFLDVSDRRITYNQISANGNFIRNTMALWYICSKPSYFVELWFTYKS